MDMFFTKSKLFSVRAPRKIAPVAPVEAPVKLPEPVVTNVNRKTNSIKIANGDDVKTIEKVNHKSVKVASGDVVKNVRNVNIKTSKTVKVANGDVVKNVRI